VLQDVVNDPTVPGLNYYWDAGSVIGTWANGNANGWYSDTVHLNDTGRAVLSNAFATDFQLHPQPVPEPASTAVVLALGLGLFVTLRRLRKL
jgi:hypothetical protein